MSSLDGGPRVLDRQYLIHISDLDRANLLIPRSTPALPHSPYIHGKRPIHSPSPSPDPAYSYRHSHNCRPGHTLTRRNSPSDMYLGYLAPAPSNSFPAPSIRASAPSVHPIPCSTIDHSNGPVQSVEAFSEDPHKSLT